MKRYIQTLMKATLYLLYKVFHPKLFYQVSLRFNQIYSMWKSNQFKSTGKNVFFQYPLYLHGGEHITVGNDFNVGLRLRIEAYDKHLSFAFNPKIKIGNNVSINSDCHIAAVNEIVIGDGVLIASKVFITDHYHGEITAEAVETPPYKRKLYSKGAVIIEKNVWIGEGVVILPNVTIGENSIIGANAVITKNIPKNSVVGGNPAKLLRTI